MVFQKKSTQNDQLTGARVSPHHLVKCISTGVPSIDTLLLGGGLPLGYTMTVVSDQPRTYGSVLHKFYASEGIESDNLVVIGNQQKTRKVSKPKFSRKRRFTNGQWFTYIDWSAREIGSSRSKVENSLGIPKSTSRAESKRHKTIRTLLGYCCY